MIAIFPAPNGPVDDYTDRPHNSIYNLPNLNSNNTLCRYYNRALLAPQQLLLMYPYVLSALRITLVIW